MAGVIQAGLPSCGIKRLCITKKRRPLSFIYPLFVFNTLTSNKMTSRSGHGVPYPTKPLRENIFKARAPWLPQMPILNGETSMGENYNWSLRGSDRKSLELYWALFQETYGDEIVPAGDSDTGNWYNIISRHTSGNGEFIEFGVVFRTKPGKPSFWPY